MKVYVRAILPSSEEVTFKLGSEGRTISYRKSQRNKRTAGAKAPGGVGRWMWKGSVPTTDRVHCGWAVRTREGSPRCAGEAGKGTNHTGP